MKKIGQGTKSEVFALPDGRILKLLLPEHAALAWQEVDILRHLAIASVTAPRVRDVVEMQGRPGVVFDDLDLWRKFLLYKDLSNEPADPFVTPPAELPQTLN